MMTRMRVCAALKSLRRRGLCCGCYVLLCLSAAVGARVEAARSQLPVEWYVVDATGAAMVSAEQLPPAAQAHAEVTLAACRGEYESASLVLAVTGPALVNLTITATDLRAASGERIAGEALQVRFVKRWYQGDTAWTYVKRSSKRRVLVPELLVKDFDLVKVASATEDNFLKVTDAHGTRYVKISAEGQAHAAPAEIPPEQLPVRDAPELTSFTLAPRSNEQLWLTVHVPEHAPPGLYRGSLGVANHSGALVIPLALRVWSFELAPAGLQYGIYYRGLLKPPGSISSEAKSEAQMQAELADMRAHGITDPTVYQPLDNEDLLRRVLALRAAAGFNSSALYYLGVRTEDTTAGSAERYAEAVRRTRRLAAPFGISKVYVYGRDEAEPDEVIRQRPAWSAVHAAGGYVFAAAWKPGYFDVLGDVLDVFVSGTAPDPQEARRFHSRGKRILLYNQPQSGIENPALYRVNYGLHLWQAGYDGTMIYAYQHGFGSIWNDFDDVEYRDHVFAYPTQNGVLDTLAWEGLREGIDDVRYVQSLIAALRTRPAGDPFSQEGARLLERLRVDGVTAPAVSRGQIALQLERLQQGS